LPRRRKVVHVLLLGTVTLALVAYCFVAVMVGALRHERSRRVRLVAGLGLAALGAAIIWLARLASGLVALSSTSPHASLPPWCGHCLVGGVICLGAFALLGGLAVAVVRSRATGAASRTPPPR
jgi:hypothetical protein